MSRSDIEYEQRMDDLFQQISLMMDGEKLTDAIKVLTVALGWAIRQRTEDAQEREKALAQTIANVRKIIFCEITRVQ